MTLYGDWFPPAFWDEFPSMADTMERNSSFFESEIDVDGEAVNVVG
jgi:hypothetical protein